VYIRTYTAIVGVGGGRRPSKASPGTLRAHVSYIRLMGRRAWGLVCVLLVVGGLATPPTLAATGGFTRILHVPADYRTVQAAVGASKPGDLILLDQGIYPGEVNVPEDKHDLTIRGVSRDGVVFDGDDRRANAIEVEADRVALENMSAHDFTANAFYWDSVDGFLGRYLTAWNVQLYGIYSLKSRHGIIEQSYVSGAADAAFYIGECYPCDTVIRGVTGRLSAVGYSGTNAGGGVTVRDSLWERNGVGILPNSYETGQEPPPQQDAVFTGNRVIGSGTVPTPVHTVLAGFIGIGSAWRAARATGSNATSSRGASATGSPCSRRCSGIVPGTPWRTWSRGTW